MSIDQIYQKAVLISLYYRPAKRELPKFKINGNDLDGNGIPDDQEGEQAQEQEEKSMPEEFSDKTNQLLEYIEKTYLKGIVGANVGDGKSILEKMKLAENSNKVCTSIKAPLILKTLASRPRQWIMDLTIFSLRDPHPLPVPWSHLWSTWGS